MISTAFSSIGKTIHNGVTELFFSLSQAGYRKDGTRSILSYWPSALSAAAATAATVATIAYAIIGATAAAILFGSIAACNLVLAGTIHVFLPQKRLEIQNSTFTANNAHREEQILTLERSIHTLEEERKEHAQLLERTQQENSTLVASLEKQNTEIAHLREDVSDFQGMIKTIGEQVQTLETLRQDISTTTIEARSTPALFEQASLSLNALQQQHRETLEHERQTVFQFVSCIQKTAQDKRQLEEEKEKLTHEVALLQTKAEEARQEAFRIRKVVENAKQFVEQRSHRKNPPPPPSRKNTKP